MMQGLRIGQMAKQLGVAVSTLRFYERRGLLPQQQRTASGYRTFGCEARGRLRFIRRARRLGMSVAEIRRLIEVPHGDPGAERDSLLDAITAKIEDLEAERDRLDALASDLRGLHMRLVAVPAPTCAHLGDCACWLP